MISPGWLAKGLEDTDPHDDSGDRDKSVYYQVRRRAFADHRHHFQAAIKLTSFSIDCQCLQEFEMEGYVYILIMSRWYFMVYARELITIFQRGIRENLVRDVRCCVQLFVVFIFIKLVVFLVHRLFQLCKYSQRVHTHVDDKLTISRSS